MSIKILEAATGGGLDGLTEASRAEIQARIALTRKVKQSRGEPRWSTPAWVIPGSARGTTMRRAGHHQSQAN